MHNEQFVICDNVLKNSLNFIAEYLTNLGYCEYCACFNPIYQPVLQWYNHRDDAPEYLRNYIDLFLLGKTVEVNKLPSEFIEHILPLADKGIMILINNTISTTDLVLLPVIGLWLFFQKPQINHTLYFGEDSVALLMRQRPAAGRTCLDLCAGPGIQSLYAARHGEYVTSVEINPVAYELSKINAIMNGLEDNISNKCGDLYNEVNGRKFDRIIANPPLLPFPEEVPYPFVGHGGDDGMKITDQIIEGLDEHLTEKGYAQIIGTGLSDGILPNFLEKLQDYSKKYVFDIICSITSHLSLARGSKMFEGLVYTSVNSANLKYDDVAEAYEKSLKKQKATHLCSYYLFIRRGEGKTYIQDVSDESYKDFWFI